MMGYDRLVNIIRLMIRRVTRLGDGLVSIFFSYNKLSVFITLSD